MSEEFITTPLTLNPTTGPGHTALFVPVGSRFVSLSAPYEPQSTDPNIGVHLLWQNQDGTTIEGEVGDWVLADKYLISYGEQVDHPEMPNAVLLGLVRMSTTSTEDDVPVYLSKVGTEPILRGDRMGLEERYLSESPINSVYTPLG